MFKAILACENVNSQQGAHTARPERSRVVLDFSDTVVAITGGGAGIGRATVSAFVELGAQVVVLEIDQDRARSPMRSPTVTGASTYW